LGSFVGVGGTLRKRNIMLKLPSEGQSFVQIRQDNFLYVDKTRFLHTLVRRGGCNFLSRPRRFGKSLLVAALEQLLRGRREFFKDLWIDSSGYDFPKYPVVRLALTGECRSEAELTNTIKTELKIAAIFNGLDPDELKMDSCTPGNMLKKLVITLYNHFQKDRQTPVGILIDEYDAPIQGVIDDTAQAEINRKVLHAFYSALKSLADYGLTKLIYITGVTKFTQTSIFSVFNNYSDLTLDPAFNDICGFTLDEFESYFNEYLPDILEYNKSKGFMPQDADIGYLKNAILDYYDGYSWDGETRILNPFSIIKMLKGKLLKAYWFSTGAPTFLMELLKRQETGFVFPENPKMSETSLNAVDIANIKLIPLLFQTGYLTVDERLSATELLLRSPNKEVGLAMEQNILDYLLGQGEDSINKLRAKIQKALANFDSASLAESFRQILLWNTHIELRAMEGQYHGLVFSVLKAMHFTVSSQIHTSEGYFDISISLDKNTVFICEFKYERFDEPEGLSEEKRREIKLKLLQKAVQDAKDQIALRNYEAGYRAEFKVVKRAAVGLTAKTDVAVEIY
jgi:hypothetical protein